MSLYLPNKPKRRKIMKSNFASISFSGINILLCLLTLPLPTAYSHPLFAEKIDYGAGAGPVSVAMGDFDGDLDLDLAVANFYGDTVSILLGAGDGTFQTAVDYSAGDGSFSVATGDIDGDLDLDLAVVNFASNNVSILINVSPIVEFTLDMDASYEAGTLSLDFIIGAPEPATWAVSLILTYPEVQFIPLWGVSLQVIDPPIDYPVAFALPQVGWAGIWSALFTEEGAQAADFAWVDTGWPTR